MIELPKIEGYNKGIENPLLINWMAFLNVRSERDMAELKSKKDLPDEILIALDELEKLSMDPNMRIEALNKEMWIRDQIGLINMAKNAEIDGYKNGFAIGEAKGLEQGIEIGRKENQEEIAIKMKNLGITIEIIVEATGLDIKTIEKL